MKLVDSIVIFFERKANNNIHLALLKLTRENCPWNLEWETDELVVIRSVLMKPEHNSPLLEKGFRIIFLFVVNPSAAAHQFVDFLQVFFLLQSHSHLPKL